jgi:hypothetical protein
MISAMSTSRPCELCGNDAGGHGFNRVAGLDVCDGCLYGDMETRLGHLGIKVGGKATQVERQVGGCYRTGTVQTFYEIEVAGNCRATSGFALAFSRETFGEKLLKLFTREIQVGDPLFDDHVFIRAKGDERAARTFLDDEGVQSAIMELVGVEGHVTIEDGSIGVFTIQEEYSALERCQLAVACLLVRLTRVF